MQSKSSNSQGDTLLSLATHELRTPLSVIKWYTEMLLDGDCGELTGDQIKYLKTIQASNQRAIDLIKALLNVSRLDLGTFSINPTEVDLRTLVKQVLDEHSSNLQEKNLHVEETYEGSVPGMIPTLNADKQLCLVIIRNLVNNAISFSHNDGSIHVEIHEKKQGEEYGKKVIKEDSLVLSVADSGIGIPEEDKEKIFSKLFRAGNVPSENTNGSGLNLYITKEIIEYVGGDIWFESTRDVGSTFFIAFPKYKKQKKEGRTIID